MKLLIYVKKFRFFSEVTQEVKTTINKVSGPFSYSHICNS